MRTLLGLLACLAFPLLSLATHVRSADIIIEPQCGTTNLTFKITIIAYLNSASRTQFGTDSQIFFGDGSSVRIPRSLSQLRPDLGVNISVAKFETFHSYIQHGTYAISYIERDRNGGVVNIANSVDVPYVTTVTLTTGPQPVCNHVPTLAVPPLDRACSGSIFYHTSGAYDVDGDSLSYELSVPMQGLGFNANYSSPADARYYLDYDHGNESKTGRPTFSINPLTGLLTWDAPGLAGEYNIAFKINEWRKNQTGVYQKLSTTVRDMQIVVEACSNIRPELIAPLDTCVVAGTSLDKIIQGLDKNGDDVKIEVFSQLLDRKLNKPTYSPDPAVDQTSVPGAKLNFHWQTDCSDVRQQPYQVIFKITDHPLSGPRLVGFRIWEIRVMAPEPEWKNNGLDLVKRVAKLHWNDYDCPSAEKIQVWRKVGSYTAPTNYCETRSPGYWGYKLIAELPPTQKDFTDDNLGRGLSVGAQYCYRLQALIGDTRSYASKEICVGPIQTDAPVITHVTIVKTSAEGSTRVSWRSPLYINKTQFPPPYEYEIYRAKGFESDSSITKVGRVRDTTFLDKSIDTELRVFNYRLVIYSKPQDADEMVAIDTSGVSSSVRLYGISGKEEIFLQWKDSVAWSNVVPGRPFHRIYRAADSDDPDDMVLLDSVNVTVNGFNYVDTGGLLKSPPSGDKLYSYRVLTRGTYGNPKIGLLENHSQVIALYPESTLPVCSPGLTVQMVDCEKFVTENNCGQTEYTNTISWSLTGLTKCRKDIRSYNIYASSSRDGRFELVASHVRDTFFVDKGLTSFARCYKVSANDRLGNEGIASDSVCNDNCPLYILPNAFTPNDDEFNNTFKAFEGPSQSFPDLVPCPRFVSSIDFKVYNRWGETVYTFVSDDQVTTLQWDGKSNSGRELESGVYYYVANIGFNVLDPENSRRQYKGWINLVR